MKKKLIALLLAFALVLCFAACGKKEEPKADTVTVTFDTDGGEAIEAQVINKGSAVVKPATPKKTGYIFDKWTLGGKDYEFGTPVNENITLKAVWTDPNGGSGEGSGDGSGGGSGDGSGGGSGGGGSASVKCEELYWVNNWYWVQEKCEGDPEWVVKPAELKSKVTFTSSDTSIATVNDKGIVYGVKPGNVTITMKCGDKTADLPLEVRSAPKPGISFDTDKVVLHYTTNESSNSLYALTVSFNNGADPSSPITWTSSNYAVAGVSNGVIGENDLGHAVITATTAEGYTASCDVYVVGTALRVFYKGAPLAYGSNLDMNFTYELSLVEEHYYESGLSKMVYVSNQCNLSAATGIGFTASDEYSGILYFSGAYISPGYDYTIQFTDPLNMVTSDLILIHVY